MKPKTLLYRTFLPLLIALLTASPGRSNELDSSEPTQLVIYDVADLTKSDTTSSNGDDPSAAMKTIAENAEQLAEALAAFVTPPLREHIESVKALGPSTIVVLGRPEQHEWIRNSLDRQRRETNTIFLIEARVLTMSLATAQTLGIEDNPITMTGSQPAEEFLRRVEETIGAEILSAPKLLVNPLASTSIVVAEEIRYIKEFKTEIVQPGDRHIVNPQVEVIRDGIEFSGLVASLEEDRIGLDFELTVSKVDRPIPFVKTQHGEIGRPTVRTRSIASKLVLPNRGTVVMSARLDENQILAMMVSVRRLREGEDRLDNDR